MLFIISIIVALLIPWLGKYLLTFTLYNIGTRLDNQKPRRRSSYSYSSKSSEDKFTARALIFLAVIFILTTIVIVLFAK